MIKTIQENGYFFDFDNGIGEVFPRHIFCGDHDIIGGICPNCDKKLLKLLSIDLTDTSLKIKVRDLHYIPLMFCWTCGISTAPFFYEILGNDKISIIKYEKGNRQNDFPYHDYPLFFPKLYTSLKQIPTTIQKKIIGLNDSSLDRYDLIEEFPYICKPNHQIGGEPYLNSYDSIVSTCPICQSEMKFLATIADQCGDPRGFTGNDYVQVVFSICTKCNVVGAIQECD